MIKLILILAYIVIFGAFAVIFLFYGRKRGWRGGAAVMISAAAAFIASYFTAPVIATELFGLQPVKQLMESAAGAAAENGIDSAVFVNILLDVMQRVLEIPSAIVLYILFFVVAFVITRTVMRFIKPKTEEIAARSKLIGAALGAAAPIIVAVLSIFASRINLFNEAGTADMLMELTSKPANEMIAQLCSDPESYTKIVFETTLTGADEKQRLELINKSIKGIIRNTDDPLLIECFDFEGYSSRSELEADIGYGAELYRAFDGIDLFGDGDLAQKVFSVSDKEGMAQKLYSISFKDCIIRYILSYTVHEMVNGGSFVYPKDMQLDGTHEDFARLVTVAGEYESGGITQLELLAGLKDSPLLPTELYAELLFNYNY